MRSSKALATTVQTHFGLQRQPVHHHCPRIPGVNSSSCSGAVGEGEEGREWRRSGWKDYGVEGRKEESGEGADGKTITVALCVISLFHLWQWFCYKFRLSGTSVRSVPCSCPCALAAAGVTVPNASAEAALREAFVTAKYVILGVTPVPPRAVLPRY